MDAAEHSSGVYVRLADRVSRYYAPFVHLVAFGTVVGWLLVGAGWHMALTTAVAVLIITCPCALGLAVPAVQVVASGFLLGRGIMVKDGGALERLAAIDTVVFDKTGTLTEGEPRLAGAPAATPAEWSLAAALGDAEPPSARPRAGACRGPRVPSSSRRSTTSSSIPATAWRDGSATASSASAGAISSAASPKRPALPGARSGSGSATSRRSASPSRTRFAPMRPRRSRRSRPPGST